MKRRSFTLMEIIIVVVVIGILATICIPGYLNLVEDSKAKICESNLKALQTGLDIYMMEHDKLPADLSQIPGEYIGRGYASVMQEKDVWKLKLAHFIVALEQRGMAYAAFLRDVIAKGEIKLITCPTAAEGANSYGLNSTLANKTRAEYDGITPNTLLVGDCTSTTFTNSNQLEDRHTHYQLVGGKKKYAQGMGKDKKIAKHEKAGANRQ